MLRESTPSLPRRSVEDLDERPGISQSTVPVLKVPVGTTFAVNNLDLAGVGRGVDESGQENESNGKSVSESHRVWREA